MGDGYHKEHEDLLQVSTGLREPVVKVLTGDCVS